jgi:hypothetical protein
MGRRPACVQRRGFAGCGGEASASPRVAREVSSRARRSTHGGVSIGPCPLRAATSAPSMALNAAMTTTIAIRSTARSPRRSTGFGTKRSGFAPEDDRAERLVSGEERRPLPPRFCIENDPSEPPKSGGSINEHRNEPASRSGVAQSVVRKSMIDRQVRGSIGSMPDTIATVLGAGRENDGRLPCAARVQGLEARQRWFLDRQLISPSPLRSPSPRVARGGRASGRRSSQRRDLGLRHSA